MSDDIFSLDAPNGVRLYMRQDDDGTYLVKKTGPSGHEYLVMASSLREHVRTAFRAEIVKLLEYWNCEVS